MISHEKRQELKNIISGKGIIGRKDYLTTARNFLSERFKTSTKVEKNFKSESIIKEEQKNCLVDYCKENNLWYSEDLSDSNFLTEGVKPKFISATSEML
jgi:hypothetical protein